MVTCDEVIQMAHEITLGYAWGDPRSRTPDTPEHRASWDALVVEIAAIKARGHIVELPFEIPL